MSLLAQPLGSTHHAFRFAIMYIQYCLNLLLRRWRIGRSPRLTLNMNCTGLAVFCPQTLDVSLCYIEFLRYHFRTPSFL